MAKEAAYNVIIIGDSAIGKSSILKQESSHEFSEYTLSTVGNDFVNLKYLIEGVQVTLKIWDTAGQEQYRTITKSNFRNKKGVILAFDLTNEESFETLEYWMKTLNEMNLDKEVMFLVGNKLDAVRMRRVSFERAQKFANMNGIKYFELSAKNGQNLHEMLESLAYDLLEMNDMKKMDKYNFLKPNNQSFVFDLSMTNKIVIKEPVAPKKMKRNYKNLLKIKKKRRAPVAKPNKSNKNSNKSSTVFSIDSKPTQSNSLAKGEKTNNPNSKKKSWKNLRKLWKSMSCWKLS